MSLDRRSLLLATAAPPASDPRGFDRRPFTRSRIERLTSFLLLAAALVFLFSIVVRADEKSGRHDTGARIALDHQVP